jgi:hypothetical protein
MTTSIQEIGMLLGKKSREQSQIKENLNPDEFDSQLVNFNQFSVTAGGTAIGTKKVYATNAFVLDHPVYGELDSLTLEIDGGYNPSGDELLITKNY